ncbi:MAG: class I SAM-dependent methyltransferase [Rhodospirillaceae bacterium]
MPSAAIDTLRAHYEAYPYPARDPIDEDRRLITGSPSHLDQLNHYVFGGRLNFSAPLRVLVAGGGTGDATIMLGQQLKDAGVPAAVTYIDLSDASRRIAEARAARRGLDNIEFHQGSLLDLDGAGPFDYIDCCGVLHHLEDPAAGLRSLAGALAPGGGIGLMVYAPYGRTGVYPLQDTLRVLCEGLDLPERVVLARRLLQSLPASNWFRRNPLLGDHAVSDAGLYDLLLHSRDRAFTVTALAALVESCGLVLTGLVEPALYEPANYLKDPKLLKRLENLPWLERAARAEEIGGVLSKHIAYAVHAGNSAAATPPDPTTLDVVPVLRDCDGVAMARDMEPGAVLDIELPGLTLALTLPRLAGPILARIDGRTDLDGVYHQLTALDRSLSCDAFHAQFTRLFRAFNSIGKMYLRRS